MFKQQDVFICKHDVHRHFSSKMSVYHVLENKQCFPHGCVFFKWKCKILAKKKKCHRNFSTVGRQCFSCKYFYEEKIHQFPQMVIENVDEKQFFSEYENYVEWIKSLEDKRILCEGKIESVRPDFIIQKEGNKYKTGVRGFLLTFKEGFIQNKLFEDQFYLHISVFLQNKFRFRSGDEIEFYSDLKINNGKLEFFHPNKINLDLRGTEKPITRSDALVSANSASIFFSQPEKCRQCAHSIIPEIQGARFGQKRALICMKGINDHQFCISFIEEIINKESEQCEVNDCNKPL